MNKHSKLPLENKIPVLVDIIKLNKNRIVRLSREFSWLVLGQALGIIGSLALLRVTTKYLLPQEYGQLTLTLTLGIFVCQVALSGVMPGIMRYYTIAVERGDITNFTKASYHLMFYGVFGTLLLSIIVCLTAFFANYASWIGGILLAIGFTQISQFNSTLSSIQNAARQRNVVVLHGIVDPWLKILLLNLLLMDTANKIILVILSYLFAASIMLCSQLFFFRRLSKLTIDQIQPTSTPWGREMFQYSKPFMVFNLFTWLQASSDRWALERFSTTQEVGQYAVLSQLGNTPVSTAVGLITNLVGPILQQRAGDATENNRNRNVWKISWLITLVGLTVTLIAFVLALLLHEMIFRYLVGPAYRQMSYLLPWAVLSGGLFASSQILSLKLMSDLDTRALITPKVATSVLAVSLNFLGAWLFGIHGIIASGLCFSLAIFLWMAYLTRKPRAISY